MKLRNVIIGICVICAILLAPHLPLLGHIGYALLHGGTLRLLGYPVDVPPWELAKQIVASGKDPTYCLQLQQSVSVAGPTIEARREDCIYEYARLTQDPTACELLMPSPHGLSCVGEARKNSLCS